MSTRDKMTMKQIIIFLWGTYVT